MCVFCVFGIFAVFWEIFVFICLFAFCSVVYSFTLFFNYFRLSFPLCWFISSVLIAYDIQFRASYCFCAVCFVFVLSFHPPPRPAPAPQHTHIVANRSCPNFILSSQNHSAIPCVALIFLFFPAGFHGSDPFSWVGSGSGCSDPTHEI